MQIDKKELLDDLAWQLGRLNRKIGFTIQEMNSGGRILMLFDKSNEMIYQHSKRIDNLSQDEIMLAAGQMVDLYLGIK